MLFAFLDYPLSIAAASFLMFLLLPQPCDDSVRAYIPDETPGFPNKSCFHSFRTNCRSEEHTSELQSLMRISYAVFCLKKKKKKKTNNNKNEKNKIRTNKRIKIHNTYIK